MSTGDQQNIFTRMRKVIPAWFNGSSPIDPNEIVDALLYGMASGYAYFYSLYVYASLQLRIATATDGNLDMIAYDFYGDALPRKGQSDAAYRIQIITSLFRERGTRKAVIDILTQLTGRAPIICEPTLPADCSAYGYSGYGYGAYGSLSHSYQALVTAFRPASNGAAGMNGYGGYLGGYGVGSQVYAHHADLFGVRDEDIYAAVASVKCEGTKIWVAIKN